MIPFVLPPTVIAPQTVDDKEYIGMAVMEPDGTIIMVLRRVQNGWIAESRTHYAPGSPDYDYICSHLPDLAVGHSVPVFNDWPERPENRK
ncbi:MAG TPA: hypothetical protein VJY39_21090 [Acidisphaera sp.]|nr:hypothetical protein [Acidisphaera sp.]